MTESNGHPEDKHPEEARWPALAEGTGDSSVDAIVASLEDVPGLPVEEHLARYTEVHDALLSALDTEES
jgi:hypothetical protein